MGAHQNLIQGAVVFVTAVVRALLDGAFDTLVGMTVHKIASFEIGFGNSMGPVFKIMLAKVSNVAKSLFLCYSLF